MFDEINGSSMGIMLVSMGGCRGVIHSLLSGIGNKTEDSGYVKKKFSKTMSLVSVNICVGLCAFQVGIQKTQVLSLQHISSQS